MFKMAEAVAGKQAQSGSELEFYSRDELEQAVTLRPGDLWFRFWSRVYERNGCWVWTAPETTYAIGPYRLKPAEIAWAYDYRKPALLGPPRCGVANCIKPSHATVVARG